MKAHYTKVFPFTYTDVYEDFIFSFQKLQENNTYLHRFCFLGQYKKWQKKWEK